MENCFVSIPCISLVKFVLIISRFWDAIEGMFSD